MLWSLGKLDWKPRLIPSSADCRFTHPPFFSFPRISLTSPRLASTDHGREEPDSAPKARLESLPLLPGQKEQMRPVSPRGGALRPGIRIANRSRLYPVLCTFLCLRPVSCTADDIRSQGCLWWRSAV